MHRMHARVCMCARAWTRTGRWWQRGGPSPPPQAHERLEETKLEAVRDNNVELVQDILRDIGHLARQDSAAAELARILREPHFQVCCACAPCVCEASVRGERAKLP